ncbi:MAG: type ISP restriction/modification enzyme [Candidatus Cloacimonadaceae bacterium]
MVEYIKYHEDQGTVQINLDKHFEGITPKLWNYHIGGYQVLHKYIKEHKNKILADPIHYCRMFTALAINIDLQAQIDQIIGSVIQ